MNDSETIMIEMERGNLKKSSHLIAINIRENQQKEDMGAQKNNRIRRLKDRFNSGLISLGDFLSAVGQLSGL